MTDPVSVPRPHQLNSRHNIHGPCVVEIMNHANRAEHAEHALAEAKALMASMATRLADVIESLDTQEPRRDCARMLHGFANELAKAAGVPSPWADRP